MIGIKYLNDAHLKGFEKYKVGVLPLSKQTTRARYANNRLRSVRTCVCVCVFVVFLLLLFS